MRNEAAFGLERGNLVAIMMAPCELPLAFRSTQYEPIFEKQFKDDHPSWIRVVERIKDLANKRSEVDKQQSRRRLGRKIGRTIRWLGAWLATASLLTAALGYVMNQGDIRPGGYEFYDMSWPGDNRYLARSGYYSFHGAGTWELITDVIGDNIAAPINYAQIECRSEWGVCVEANSEILHLGNIVLNSYVDERQIELWSDRLIVAKTEDPCFTYTLTINRDTKSVTALLTRPDDIAQRAECTSGMVNQAELTQRKELRLVDGSRRELERVIAQGRTTFPIFFGGLAILGVFVLYRIFLVWRARQ